MHPHTPVHHYALVGLIALTCSFFSHDVLAQNATSIPQSGAKALAIQRSLSKIKLPQGFAISLYALVPGARHLAVAPAGNLVFVGTRGSELWAVADTSQRGVADEVVRYAPKLNFDLPNGVCFASDGTLYSVEFNRVRAFPQAQKDYKNADVAVETIVPQDKLIPTTETGRGHGARVCRIGPDNKLYITLGQPFNVPPKEKLPIYRNSGMMGILRMDRDGSHHQVYAYGIRNSVGMDFNPADNTLWFTDNQVDLMGDDIPPGEINRATKIGQDFGFPYYGGGHTRTHEYQHDQLPADLVGPEVETVAHAADLGMVFYRGSQFPEKYRDGIFSAQHGSWNRSTPVGAQLLFTRLNQDGTANSTEVFASGWLTPNHEYSGRPVDVATLPDGSLLVSDDYAGALYRIYYVVPAD